MRFGPRPDLDDERMKKEQTYVKKSWDQVDCALWETHPQNPEVSMFTLHIQVKESGL